MGFASRVPYLALVKSFQIIRDAVFSEIELQAALIHRSMRRR
jgi:hypothetical protein